MKAMIFAAGLGTRLKPLTDNMPKALVPVDGKPLLQHLIEKMKRQGVTRIVINVHHFASQIVDFLAAHGSFGMDIRISDETAQLLDTGGGLRRAWPLLFEEGDDSPVIVHNVDILSNLNLPALMEQHEASRAAATIVVSPRDTQRYFLFDAHMRLRGWTNVKTGEVRPAGLPPADCVPLAFAGIHVVSPTLLPLLTRYPEVFSITQLYWEQAANAVFHGCQPARFRMMDVGKINTLPEADAFCRSLAAEG